MRIGIDISQAAYEGTGVGNYVRQSVRKLLAQDDANEYVLFGASLRSRQKLYDYYASLKPLKTKARLVVIPVPPTILDILWNILHVVPVEWFIGSVDVFWSSDWTQPPLMDAYGVTTIHDVSFLRFPESFSKKIMHVQKRRLKWAKKECRMFLCDSKATKYDVVRFLRISEAKLRVVYPGFDAMEKASV